MEGNHFDRLARAVATSCSRRRVLAAVLIAAWGSLRIRTATADDESGIAIADASGGNHNQATATDPATTGNDRDRNQDRDDDDDRDSTREGDGDPNNGGPSGLACALCGLVEGPRTCGTETVFCDTSTVELCCEFGQDVECCADCATLTPIARCCTPGVDCAPDGGPCAGLDVGSVGCQCAEDAHCAPGAFYRNPCTPGVPCGPNRGICDR